MSEYAEVRFEPRKILLPEGGHALLKIMEGYEVPAVRKAVEESMGISYDHRKIGEGILENLMKFEEDYENLLFLICRENERILGVTNGEFVGIEDEIYGLSLYTMNTSGVRGIGRKLFEAKVDVFFSLPEVEIIYALPSSQKSRKILENTGFRRKWRGKYHAIKPYKPYLLTREVYEGLRAGLI